MDMALQTLPTLLVLLAMHLLQFQDSMEDTLELVDILQTLLVLFTSLREKLMLDISMVDMAMQDMDMALPTLPPL